MNKNKKIVISICVVVAIAVIIGVWFLVDSLNKSNKKIDELETKMANNTNSVNIGEKNNTVNNLISNTTNTVTNTTANNSTANKTNASTENKNESTNKDTTNSANEKKVERITENEMYETVINEYKNAVNEYNSNDINSEKNIGNKYQMVNSSLIAHVAHYKADGVKLTYGYYDIDNNGISELIVSASGGIGAVYSYNSDTYKPVKIFYQDTLERGNLSIYNNGVLLSAGSGGAAFHNYEFGKISSNGISYELIEDINEEYKGDVPEYRDAKTDTKLNYKSLDEIKTKYLSNAQELKINFNYEI